MALDLRVKNMGCSGTRRGRNPATGEDLPLDARTAVIFRCSGVLKDRANGWGMELLRESEFDKSAFGH